MSTRSAKDWAEVGVRLAKDVEPSRISPEAVIYPGSRINGKETSIGPGSEIGSEAPVALNNCQLGRNVKLKGGFFDGAVFFEGANMGSGAHVRPGCIFEEEANGAHTVGLKQTILLPFVTLGSLINFCDVLMAGGTSRKNHSEVGSSYVHFNFTPHQDKATASLIGDVSHGVFLDRAPVFLGGQGGLVGPARIAYGTVVAAGGICRQDVLEENQLHVPAVPNPATKPYETGVYRKIDRIVANNLAYVGNVRALREWYRNVRSHFLRDSFDLAVLDGGVKNLDLVLVERIKRLGELASKMEHSVQWLRQNGGSAQVIDEQVRFKNAWPEIKTELGRPEMAQNEQARAAFLAGIPTGSRYIETIQSLESNMVESGRAWLQSIVDSTTTLWR